MPFIARRFGFLLLAIWASITLNFAIPRLLPGNPAEAVYANHVNQFGNNPHEVQTIQLALGLSHKPIVTQYFEYLGALLHGDLGLSFNYFPVKVSTIIGQTLPWTLFMVGIASIIAFVVGTSAGVIAAYRRGGAIDSFLLPLTQLTSNFPFFFLALVLLYVFGLTLGWFPVSHARNQLDLVGALRNRHRQSRGIACDGARHRLARRLDARDAQRDDQYSRRGLRCDGSSTWTA
jgi:peptide/nickel transport system permease protein